MVKFAPVAIYGMSADPAHRGHLKVAEAIKNLGYERVIWMLTPQNPLKQTVPTAFMHRMELTRLLVGRRTWLEVSDAEGWMQLYGDDLRTHTMLGQLKKIYPETPFTFVMGSDNWMHFHLWGRFVEIMDFAGLLIIPRPGGGNLAASPAAASLAKRRDPNNEGPVTQGCWRILGDMPGGNASSTQIRNALKNGGEATKWLNAEQLDYIKLHGLYR